MRRNKQVPLQAELNYFNKHKAEFLQHYKGQFVLIKGSELVGAYTTEQEAYQAGVQKFGAEPFFIRQVVEKEQVVAHPALTAGLMYAGSQ